MLRVAVLGAGGVGGFVAAALARSGEDVIVIAREPTAALIARDGVDVRSVLLGDFVARPNATETLDHPVDVLLIATKSTTLDEALQRIKATPKTVVPLLNGIEHMAKLRQHFDNVLAATIRIESDRPRPGHIVQTSPSALITLAQDVPLKTTLQHAGIPTTTGPSEPHVLWSKLVRLCPLALTTSAADRPIGFIRTDPEWRATLTSAIEEAAAVANADGARIDPADTVKELDSAHESLGSSMQRDLKAGRPTELDAIAGAVIRAGARHRLQTATIARLAAQVEQRGR